MERADFELGADVTAQAKAEGKRETVVLSVRVSADEFRRLDALAQVTGKSVSQLAREALSSYSPAPSGSQATYSVTFAFPSETTSRKGSPSQATGLSVPATSR